MLSGPAVDIYRRKLGITNYSSMDDLPQNTDLLLVSTGWSTDNEYNMMKIAKNRQIPIIAVLDHWFGYKERFTRFGETNYPNQILVFDNLAAITAKTVFPETQILIDTNYYIKDSIDKFNEINSDKTISHKIYDFLFLCEPRSLADLRPHHEKYSDFDSLVYFFDVLKSFGLEKKKILLRPHPSEESDKYLGKIPREFEQVRIDRSGDLPLAIALSSCVVGCNTMGMVVALEAGRNVFSVVPPPFETKLPFPNILPISKLIDCNLGEL